MMFNAEDCIRNAAKKARTTWYGPASPGMFDDMVKDIVMETLRNIAIPNTMMMEKIIMASSSTTGYSDAVKEVLRQVKATS